MVEIKPIVFILQLLTFIVAAPLLWKLYISKLIKTVKDRDAFIKESIEKVENGKAEVEQMKEDYENKLEELKAEAKAAMEKAVSEGEKQKNTLVEEAKSEGQKLIANAKKEIEAEKKRAIEEVKDTMVDISMLAAKSVIKANLTKKAQSGIIEKAIKEVKKN